MRGALNHAWYMQLGTGYVQQQALRALGHALIMCALGIIQHMCLMDV